MFKLMAANNKSNTWYEIVALYPVHIVPSVKQNTQVRPNEHQSHERDSGGIQGLAG